MELEEVINKRISIRHYKDEPVTEEEVSKLVSVGLKVPSAGGIHPIKIVVVYDKEVKERLCRAALGQKCVEEAFVDLVVLADYSKVTPRYHTRGYRYVLLEAGHVGQNISLMATSLGLGTVMIGAFRDADVKTVLGIEIEEPIYIIPVGRM